MEPCQVCGGDVVSGFSDGLRRCSSCYWPADFAKSTGSRLAIDEALLGWAKNMYDQYVRTPAAPETTVARDDGIQQVNDKVEQVMAFCQQLQEARTQDRHDYDQKLTALLQEVRFLKDGIGHNQSIAARVTALENWCQTVYQDILELQKGSLAELSGGNVEVTLASSQPENSGDLAALALLQAALTPAERELVERYNQSADLAESLMVQDASLDLETFNRLRDGDASKIVFVAERKGTFIVVPKDGQLYVLPSKKRSINAHIYRSVKSIYKCTGYTEDYERSLLIKPAVVQEIAEHQWQLSQVGILQFF